MWLGWPVGLFVPYGAQGTGALLGSLPHPLDDLLRMGTEEQVTLGALAELDGRVWLLGVGAATAMLVLAAGLQLVTAPVATQMMAKAAHRTGQYRADLVVDDRDRDEPADAGEPADGDEQTR